MKYLASLKRHRKGIYVAGLIGFISIIIHDFSGSPLLDSLLVALTLGIAVRSFVKFSDDFKSDFYAAPGMLIPPGVVLYGAVNLNFSEFQVIDSYFYYIPFVVLMVYLMTILFLSYLFGVKEKESYLIAAGSTICGASAITVTSRSIGAKPDEVARSLISVYLSALIGLCLLIPFVSSYFGLSDVDYSVFIGTVFQFTGFVKVAARDSPIELQQLALAVKATRYVGLFFLIPTFS
ncbi:MAG: putative sulfate exporter family transporter, partial [Waddliaceae bacterium]